MINKRKVALMLVPLLVLSTILVFTIPVIAEPLPKPGIVDWVDDPLTPQIEGEEVHKTLECDPEWLKVWTVTHVSHDTEIIVHGKDTFGQDIEAKAFIPTSTDPQHEFPLIDVHSLEPVAFSKITAVFQQGGEHCNVFQVHTLPEPKEDWLGMYHTATGYVPHYEAGYPVEPSNPDPLKVAINWVDKNGDGQPTEDECTAPGKPSTIIIKGLDQYGDVLEVSVSISSTAKIVYVDVLCHTWSTVCTVGGGAIGISYYIWTHPKPQRAIFEYKIAVHHISVIADPKNILADGVSTSTITITLLDQDGHEVHWTTDADPIEINVATTGGKVKPSLDIKIPGCSTSATTTLISDTNARIVKVSALAIVPETPGHSAMQLKGSDTVCFDGLNSVPYAKPYEIVDIGGTGSGRYYAVFKRLDEGCNLISMPVIPDEALTWDMLPCASQCLKSVATYQGGVWLYYDFPSAVGDIIPIRDGWAYWVKAEKPCTLVISGKFMDQYDPITGSGLPPMYPMALGWNFVGVTSIRPIPTANYFESLHDMGLGEKLWGPVWVYRNGKWGRNPTNLVPTEGVWLFTYDGILAP